jgi:hypothetical protein
MDDSGFGHEMRSVDASDETISRFQSVELMVHVATSSLHFAMRPTTIVSWAEHNASLK